MKNFQKLNLILLLLSVLALGCKKEKLEPVNQLDPAPPGSQAPNTVSFDPAQQTLVSQGNFKSGAHTTSGVAKLYQQGNKYTLLFENFKTDEGPDLKIYLAETTDAKNYIQLAELKNTGTFFLTLPDDAKVNDRKQVLIWCKRFAVSFGSAELVVPAKK